MPIKERIESIKSSINSWKYSQKYSRSESSSDTISNDDLEKALDAYGINDEDDEKYFREESDGYVPRYDYGYHRNYLGISHYGFKMILLILIIIVFALVSIWFLKPGRIPYTKT